MRDAGRVSKLIAIVSGFLRIILHAIPHPASPRSATFPPGEGFIMYRTNEGTPDGVPFRFLAAAVIIVVAAVPVVAAGIPAAVAVAAAEEQQNQNDDPPAVVAAPVVTTHNQYLRLKFSERSVAHSMLFRKPIFVQRFVGEGHCPSRNLTGRGCNSNRSQENSCHPERSTAKSRDLRTKSLLRNIKMRRSLDSFYSLGMTNLLAGCANLTASASKG